MIDRGLGELGASIERAADRVRTEIVEASSLVRSGHRPKVMGASVVLVGCRSASGEPSAAVIELIRLRHPHVSVWVCARPDEGAGAEVVRYARAGAGWVFEIGPKSELRSSAHDDLEGRSPRCGGRRSVRGWCAMGRS